MNQRFVQLVAMILVVALTVGAPAFCRADWISPEQTQATTPRYDGVTVDYVPGTYVYDIGWQGIPVATARITVQRLQSGEFHVAARVESARGVRWLYSLKHVSEAIFSPSPFAPVRFSSRQLENSRAKYRTVTFLGDAKLKGRDWKPGKKGEEYNLNTNNQTLDPMSAAFLAINLPIQVNSSAAFDIFNGKHRFVISLKAEKIEEIENQGQKTRAFKIIPSLKKLTDTDGEKRFKGAALWITESRPHKILKLSSKVWIGSIVAQLVQFEAAVPLEKPDTVKARVAAPDSAPSFE